MKNVTYLRHLAFRLSPPVIIIISDRVEGVVGIAEEELILHRPIAGPAPITTLKVVVTVSFYPSPSFRCVCGEPEIVLGPNFA